MTPTTPEDRLSSIKGLIASGDLFRPEQNLTHPLDTHRPVLMVTADKVNELRGKSIGVTVLPDSKLGIVNQAGLADYLGGEDKLTEALSGIQTIDTAISPAYTAPSLMRR
ncbi:MAG: hypothetical protein B7X02_00570 [Rhodospirillales bacterium 12-54-5]|nr:MAG: hypothetical protein B7X02_00570 [Rhodospirillales bacterium 12-54-5]